MTPTPRNELAVLLTRLSRGIARIERHIVADGELSPEQIETLALIAERHRISVNELADAQEIATSTASRNLEALRRGGRLRRVRSTTDGRRAIFELTPIGLAYVRSIFEYEATHYGGTLKKLPPRQRAEMLDAVRTLVRWFAEPGPPAWRRKA